MERREVEFVNTSTRTVYPAKQGGSSSERIMMREKWLCEASLSGNVESLNQLMEEDRLTLARVSVTCFNETPLHIASMQGHSEFAKAVLGYKPDMAKELNSKGQSPLHLASANGYIEIVKILLQLDPQVCLVRDEDGRTPLHLAAMKGRADIVEELVRARPEVTGYRLDRGETLLHLCVVHNRLEALMRLVTLGEWSRIEDGVNAKDDDGNTILHIATTLKQLETIKFLLSGTGVKVNAVNGNGTTALDIIEHTPRDLKAMEIRELLVKSGGLRSKNIPADAISASNGDGDDNNINTSREDENDEQPPQRRRPPPPLPSRSNSIFVKYMKKQDDWLKNNRDSLMLAATLIAAMAYESGLNPPGGFWDQDHPGQKAGTSILAANFPDAYPRFWIFNTVSFMSSLSILLLLVSGLPLKKRIFIWILMAATWVTISSMTLTYFFTMAAISPEGSTAIGYVVEVSIIGWLALVGIVFLCHTIRFILWIIRKVRKFRKNRLVNQTSGQV